MDGVPQVRRRRPRGPRRGNGSRCRPQGRPPAPCAGRALPVSSGGVAAQERGRRLPCLFRVLRCGVHRIGAGGGRPTPGPGRGRCKPRPWRRQCPRGDGRTRRHPPLSVPGPSPCAFSDPIRPFRRRAHVSPGAGRPHGHYDVVAVPIGCDGTATTREQEGTGTMATGSVGAFRAVATEEVGSVRTWGRGVSPLGRTRSSRAPPRPVPSGGSGAGAPSPGRGSGAGPRAGGGGPGRPPGR